MSLAPVCDCPYCPPTFAIHPRELLPIPAPVEVSRTLNADRSCDKIYHMCSVMRVSGPSSHQLLSGSVTQHRKHCCWSVPGLHGCLNMAGWLCTHPVHNTM
jgi:hypothetical protein